MSMYIRKNNKYFRNLFHFLNICETAPSPNEARLSPDPDRFKDQYSFAGFKASGLPYDLISSLIKDFLFINTVFIRLLSILHSSVVRDCKLIEDIDAKLSALPLVSTSQELKSEEYTCDVLANLEFVKDLRFNLIRARKDIRRTSLVTMGKLMIVLTIVTVRALTFILILIASYFFFVHLNKG